MNTVAEIAPALGVAVACAALAVSRATFYRRRKPEVPAARPVDRPVPQRALTVDERDQVLGLLHSDRFVDKAPAEVYATLLDEGTYHCSVRTMYRILAAAGEVRERRDQLRHPTYAKPELVATAPNQVWSWDITKLLGPAKWTYFYLYVLLDIFSRYVVGWLVADGESSTLAQRLIADSANKQRIEPGQLTVHADRGTSMTSKGVALLLADLGITKTHSRPHVSDDNPFSESQFKTLKYRPDFPERFGCLEDARAFCRHFFGWYNDEHHHSGLGLLTPATVHYRRTDVVLSARSQVLLAAYATHPERFVHRPPRPVTPPPEAWINPPPPRAIRDQQVLPNSHELLSTAVSGGGDQRHLQRVSPPTEPPEYAHAATSAVGNGALRDAQAPVPVQAGNHTVPPVDPSVRAADTDFNQAPVSPRAMSPRAIKPESHHGAAVDRSVRVADNDFNQALASPPRDLEGRGPH
jgi:putative transposase